LEKARGRRRAVRGWHVRFRWIVGLPGGELFDGKRMVAMAGECGGNAGAGIAVVAEQETLETSAFVAEQMRGFFACGSE
jgi:hypothetical protein